MIKQKEFDGYALLEQYISQEELSKIRSELLICPHINTFAFGNIIKLSKNYAKSIFIPTPEMIVDDYDLIHDCFVATAASFVAQAAINKEFSVIIRSNNFFYSPLKFGDILELEAQALFDDNSKKREVKVVGCIKEVKVFEGVIQFVVTEEHILKLKRPNLDLAEAADKEEA